MLFNPYGQTTRSPQIFGTSLGPGSLQNPPVDALPDMQPMNQMPVATPAGVAPQRPAQPNQKRMFGLAGDALPTLR